jgi:hypothetical protein
MSECICVDSSYNLAEVSKTENRTARKEHICCECRDKIKVGDKYEYVSGLWDGIWREYKTCRICVKIRDDFFSCGFYYGEMSSHLRDEGIPLI